MVFDDMPLDKGCFSMAWAVFVEGRTVPTKLLETEASGNIPCLCLTGNLVFRLASTCFVSEEESEGFGSFSLLVLPMALPLAASKLGIFFSWEEPRVGSPLDVLLEAGGRFSGLDPAVGTLGLAVRAQVRPSLSCFEIGGFLTAPVLAWQDVAIELLGLLTVL